MSAIRMSFSGGREIKVRLGMLQDALGRAKGMKVGILENAKYPDSQPLVNAKRLRRVEKRLRKAHDPDADRVGAWAAWGERNPVGNLYVAQVAFWNEFGTSHMPPRPFFRSTIRNHSAEWAPAFVRYLRANANDGARALRMLGVHIEEELREAIRTWPDDNAPLTRKIKNSAPGFGHALIDRGVMQRALSYEVIMK